MSDNKEAPASAVTDGTEPVPTKQKPKKKKRIGIFPFIIFLLGAGILLYPTVSNYYNVVHQSNAIVEYAENLAAMDNEFIQEMWARAIEHNEQLYAAQLGEELPEDALQHYDEILRVTENGMMGYIDVPKVKIHLPIYHGTSEPVLQKGVGHLEWSSFPVGGENTHTVLTGHTGLPSARLFTDLDQVEVGDLLLIQILGEKMTYEVDSIETVLPYEIDSLSIFEGKDLCTLVTCTPYGVNSHRLLVHAHRIENEEEEVEIIEVTKEVEVNARDPMIQMVRIAAAAFAVLVIAALWGVGRRKKKKKNAMTPPAETKPEEEKTEQAAEEEEKPDENKAEEEPKD
ncbi:MAG: class C sortase [Oscillospiraceae bacterium]|nr:class C sortase [Oscillospiraceae bacterium]